MKFDSAEYIVQGSFITTKDFTKGEYNFEPMASIVDDNEDYVFNYDKLIAIDESLAVQFMDAGCFNMERNTYNYGLLKEQTSGKIVKMAPNFDNNIALVSRGYFKIANRCNFNNEIDAQYIKDFTMDR